MIAGDYIERGRITRTGRAVTDKIVKATTGAEYAIGKKLGAGGVAKVYRARRVSDKKECVFKEYAPSPETRRMHSAIKRNIQNLIKNPLTEDDGKTPLQSFVGPLDKDSLIELPASKGFGYIMELVDTESFLPIPKLWHRETYPDALAVCKACFNLAHLFRRVHFKGWCYKDINEGNIYINNRTGEIRIIDCDNISVQSTKTIKGTDGYMAPEVYVTSTPDTYTDYFSLAVLFYRVLVGGYPMDGKRTRQYLLDNNLSITEAASTVYGSEAVFAFDPKNSSNEIRGLIDPLNARLYSLQTKRWDNLPERLRLRFIQTLSTGLANANRNKRATDRDWMTAFEELKRDGLVRCRCGKWNFGDANNRLACSFCQAMLPVLKPPVQKPPAQRPPIQMSPAQRPQTVTAELTTVSFNAKRDIAPTHLCIIARRKHQLQGAAIYAGLNEGWMRIEYNPTRNMLAAKNCSKLTWTVHDNDVRRTCAPGERVVLKVGLIITVMVRKLQLTVTELK